jgi:hypothetical protein
LVTGSLGTSGAFFLHRASVGLVSKRKPAAFFSEPQIDHFVMAITSGQTTVRHTALDG